MNKDARVSGGVNALGSPERVIRFAHSDAPHTRRFPRIVSLSDMLRFHAVSFTAAVAKLQHAESALVSQWLTESDILSDQQAEINMALADVVEACAALPLSSGVLEQAKMVQSRVGECLLFDHQRSALIAVIQHLRQLILDNLTQHLFLLVPADRKELLAQNKPLFGRPVIERFPAAYRDIAAAGSCLGTDQWTAAVFHLMRVLEHGLRDLADRVKAEFPTAIELENWKNIIDKIESQIRTQEKLPKSQQKSDDLEFYTKAASQFWHFKEAWRNHVAHSRATYDETEAFNVYNAVKHFMQQLATRP